MTEESEVKARWAGYFERLYQADPPAVQLEVRGVTNPIADPPINCEPLSFVETQAGVNRLKGSKLMGFVASMLNFSRLVEMLFSCHCMQFCALFGTQASSQLTGRGALLFLSGKGRMIAKTATTSEGVMLLSVPGKFFAQIILDRVCHHLLEHQRDQAAVHRLEMPGSLTLISQRMQSSLRRCWISL